MQAYLTSLATEELKQDEPRVKLFFTADSEGPVNRIRSLCKMKCVIAPHEHDLEKKEKNEGGWSDFTILLSFLFLRAPFSLSHTHVCFLSGDATGVVATAAVVLNAGDAQKVATLTTAKIAMKPR